LSFLPGLGTPDAFGLVNRSRFHVTVITPFCLSPEPQFLLGALSVATARGAALQAAAALAQGEWAMAKGSVKIVVERCKACGFCVEFCPTKVLALSSAFNSKGYHPPHMVAPEKCSGCDLCGMYCPDFAIFGYRIDEKGAKKEEAAHEG